MTPHSAVRVLTQAAETHWADRGPRSLNSLGSLRQTSSVRLYFAYRVVVEPMAAAVKTRLMTSL